MGASVRQGRGRHSPAHDCPLKGPSTDAPPSGQRRDDSQSGWADAGCGGPCSPRPPLPRRRRRWRTPPRRPPRPPRPPHRPSCSPPPRLRELEGGRTGGGGWGVSGMPWRASSRRRQSSPTDSPAEPPQHQQQQPAAAAGSFSSHPRPPGRPRARRPRGRPAAARSSRRPAVNERRVDRGGWAVESGAELRGSGRSVGRGLAGWDAALGAAAAQQPQRAAACSHDTTAPPARPHLRLPPLRRCQQLLCQRLGGGSLLLVVVYFEWMGGGVAERRVSAPAAWLCVPALRAAVHRSFQAINLWGSSRGSPSAPGSTPSSSSSSDASCGASADAGSAGDAPSPTHSTPVDEKRGERKRRRGAAVGEASAAGRGATDAGRRTPGSRSRQSHATEHGCDDAKQEQVS